MSWKQIPCLFSLIEQRMKWNGEKTVINEYNKESTHRSCLVRGFWTETNLPIRLNNTAVPLIIVSVCRAWLSHGGWGNRSRFRQSVKFLLFKLARKIVPRRVPSCSNVLFPVQRINSFNLSFTIKTFPWSNREQIILDGLKCLLYFRFKQRTFNVILYQKKVLGKLFKLLLLLVFYI